MENSEFAVSKELNEKYKVQLLWTFYMAITCSKVNNRIIRVRCEIFLKLTIKNQNAGKCRLGYYVRILLCELSYLKCDERLKRIPIMTRINNVAMRESNDNIDHNKMVITWISFADEVKKFS